MLGLLIGGSAATTGAVVLARAYTGKDYVIRSGYHGWHDWTTAVRAGVPQQVGNLTLETPYMDLQALEDLLKAHAGQVACVIMETTREDDPTTEFLQGCVDLAHQYDALCIFDEIKVGVPRCLRRRRGTVRRYSRYIHFRQGLLQWIPG